MIRPCKEFLGFDDRRFMLVAIPAISLVMPLMIDFGGNTINTYLFHGVPESLFFTIGFWSFYRTLIIGLRKKYPRFRDTRRRIILQSMIILISAPVLKAVFGLFIYTLLRFFGIEAHNTPGYLSSLFSIYLPSGLIVAVYEAVYFFAQYKLSVIEKEKIQTAHVQTQLDNLRNQINPHFLFNSLNTLMNLIPDQPERAMSFLSKLSQFYRYTVGNHSDKLVSVDKEIESARIFADLLAERFKNGIHIDFKVPSGTSDLILPMSLQLLIENAVKHNIVSKSSPLTVQVSMSENDQYIVVSNNKQPKLEEVQSSGMGLNNIVQRFSYFTSSKVIIEDKEETFIVHLPIIQA